MANKTGPEFYLRVIITVLVLILLLSLSLSLFIIITIKIRHHYEEEGTSKIINIIKWFHDFEQDCVNYIRLCSKWRYCILCVLLNVWIWICSLSGPDPRSGKLLTDKNVSLQERVFSVLYCTFFSWVPLLSLTVASENLVLRVSTELQASMLGEVDSRPEWWLERRWADKHPHCILFLRRRDYSVPLGSSGVA